MFIFLLFRVAVCISEIGQAIEGRHKHSFRFTYSILQSCPFIILKAWAWHHWLIADWVIVWQWRHKEHDGVSNHQAYDCFLNRLFSRRSKKTWKLRVTGLCEENSPVTGEFPTQRASNAENVSFWWRHYEVFGRIIHVVAAPWDLSYWWLYPRDSNFVEFLISVAIRILTTRSL